MTDDWRHEIKGPGVVATWSGGIDSTAVVCELLSRGINVYAVSFVFGRPGMIDRESDHRCALLPEIQKLSKARFEHAVYDVQIFLDEVREAGGPMIPNRNKRFIDLLMSNAVIPRRCFDLAMGEYVGADTWVVKDHVGAHDADARYLEAYLLSEYGHEYRLWTLRDFGRPQRFKSDRVRILARHLSDPSLTTNCLLDGANSCGRCYKCIERAAAFKVAGVPDHTVYDEDPRQWGAYASYMDQMHGTAADLPFASFGMEAP